ncbi:hypothetical protein HX747_30350 [Streptomyces sp. L06]|nr:hypothetical protein [Streptomyces sp. L06]
MDLDVRPKRYSAEGVATVISVLRTWTQHPERYVETLTAEFSQVADEQGGWSAVADRPFQPSTTVGRYLVEAADALGRAYKPTRKHSGLAVARYPQRMKLVFSSLSAALDAVCTDLSTQDPEVAMDHASTRRLLTELEDRVCATVPSQGASLSAEEVAAAIRTSPEVARAASAALAGLGSSRPAALGTSSL